MPTFLLFRGHRSVVQQCCVRLHSTSNNVAPAHAHYMPRILTNTCEQGINMASEMENVPESFVFSSKDPTCCDLLRAFAHIGQHRATRDNIVGPNNVVCCCERLHGPLVDQKLLSRKLCVNIQLLPRDDQGGIRTSFNHNERFISITPFAKSD